MDQPGALVGCTNAAVDFDGSDDCVSVSDSDDFDFGSAMTAVAWVKGAAQSGRTVVAHFDTGADERSWRMGSDTSSTARLRVTVCANGTGTTYKELVSSIDVFDDEWHLVAFAFDSGDVTLYVDGREDTDPTATSSGTVTSLNAPSADVPLP
jgi:hypothetical protein